MSIIKGLIMHGNSDYTDEAAEQICFLIASNPCGLKKICKANPDLPRHSTIYEWLAKYPEFREKYRAAKAVQVESIVDDMFDIADDSTHDTVIRTTKNGDEYEACDNEWINRSRVRLDYRKWLVGKLSPRLYGDLSNEQKEGSVVEKILERLNSVKGT